MRSFLTALLMLTSATVLFAAAPKPLELSAADNGKTVAVKVGQDVNVWLEGNITTGYSWDLAKIDGQSVALDGQVTYDPKAHPPGMVGGGGTFKAKFKTLRPGKSTVRMEYRRPWEKDVKSAEKDIFTVTILVEK